LLDGEFSLFGFGELGTAGKCLVENEGGKGGGACLGVSLYAGRVGVYRVGVLMGADMGGNSHVLLGGGIGVLAVRYHLLGQMALALE
jgi:hypothetical protein